MRYIYYIFFFLLIIIFLHLKITVSSCRSFVILNKNLSSNHLTYYKFNDSRTSYSLSEVNGYQNILDTYNFSRQIKLHESNIVFFHLLTDYGKLYEDIVKIPSIQYVASLRCIDLFCSKSKLFDISRLHMNNKDLVQYLPETYLLGPNQNLTNIDDGELYILKKNIQRQHGLYITRKLSKIQNAHKNNYVVCQKLLQDVFTINNRKINLRIYLLVTMKTTPAFYIYNNGFIYYTKKNYVKNSIDPDVHITTGYIDRTVYEKNPMTLKDLESYLGKEQYSILNESIIDCLQHIMYSYVNILKTYDTSSQTNFVIFGCDFAVSSDLSCKLMEINKGPDLNYKDKRDKDVKFNLVKDTMITVGIIEGSTNNFTQLKV